MPLRLLLKHIVRTIKKLWDVNPIESDGLPVRSNAMNVSSRDVELVCSVENNFEPLLVRCKLM